MRPPKISPRLLEWSALLGILLIGAFLRFYQLEYKSLWVDEIGQVVAAQGGVTGALAGAARHVAAPPLDYLVTWLSMQIGRSEFILRFAPAAWSIQAIALLYALAKELTHSPVKTGSYKNQRRARCLCRSADFCAKGGGCSKAAIAQ